jgi:hypothetical protein
MSRADRLVLLLSLIAILVTYFVADRVFERMAHIEDEMAYVWQAQAIAKGYLTVPEPPVSDSFLVPFVVDHNDQRFGKYPLGWPAMLAIGLLLGVRTLINPVLSGIGVWLTYRLGKRVLGETVGLLAAGLTITSAFFLMNSGSLLSHPLGLVLSAAFVLAWLDTWDDSQPPRKLPLLVAGISLGVLALTRPMTALGISLLFIPHGLYLFIRRDWNTRRRLLAFTVIVLGFASIHFIWQFAVTGDPLLNPYTLWWEYDTIGFGPGVGRADGGHTLSQARINTRFSLWVGWHDLFGWGAYSWIFLPIGLLAILRHRQWNALLVVGVFPSLVLVYSAYWIGSFLFGPRYYYEGLFSLTILSGAGIAFLAGWPTHPAEPWQRYKGWQRIRPLLVTAVVILLISANLFFYLPMRVGGMQGLYGVSRARLEPFLTPEAQDITPALVIVHADRWTDYGSLHELQNPLLNTPFIFVISRGTRPDRAVAAEFPQRTTIYYYPDEPYIFYLNPREED